VGITWAISLTAAVCFFYASGLLCLGTLGWEWRHLRRLGKTWVIGWRPLGNNATFLAIAFSVMGVLSLIDIQHDRELFMSMTIYDHGSRVNWIDSVLRTGVPPANPLFWYKHAAPMRNYYFWYVVCAVVVRMTHISGRCSLIASCVWSGLALVSVVGLYLKHFLGTGPQLRKQFLTAMVLLAVSGLDILVHSWNIFVLHIPIFDRAGVWPEINSWFVTLSLAPHHIVSLVCCMFAFLLAWMAGRERHSRDVMTFLLIACALASAFGLSVYVGFAFFLTVVAWGLWQFVFERRYRSPLFLMLGGAAGALLIAPYVWSLRSTSSGMHGTAPFGIAIRETFPSAGLLSWGIFQDIASKHTYLARDLANLILLAPGLAVELGFFLFVFLLYLVPGFHGRKALNAERRSLLFIAAISILISSLLKSQVLLYNDFGFRAALFAQFALLLFGSEVMTAWKLREMTPGCADDSARLPTFAPHGLRAITALALIFGFLSTVYYASMFRFIAPLIEAAHKRAVQDPLADNLSHAALTSYFGYRHLNASIPSDAIVQFNPSFHNQYWTVLNLVGIRHQTAAAFDEPWCGAELGGDPNGCLAMGAPIARIYKDASVQQALGTCSQFGIQFLVATTHDPIWNDRSGWVWQLPPVVQDPEFRALDCRAQAQIGSSGMNSDRHVN
jgi:hypothetical protein